MGGYQEGVGMDVPGGACIVFVVFFGQKSAFSAGDEDVVFLLQAIFSANRAGLYMAGDLAGKGATRLCPYRKIEGKS